MPAVQKAQPLRTLHELVDDAARKNEAATKSTQRHEGRPTKSDLADQPNPAPEPPGTFYVYSGTDGTQHIVDSVKMIPKTRRKTAKRWVMEVGDGRGSDEINTALSDGISTIAETVKTVTRPAQGSPTAPDAPGFHLTSFLLGVALGAVVFVGPYLLKKRSSLLVKAVIGLVVAAIAGAAYFGWVRRQAGLSDDAIAEPRSMIDDARNAAQLLRDRNAEEQRRLEEIDKQPETIILP